MKSAEILPTKDAVVVSVILVNFRGASDTIAAIENLEKLNWPAKQLQIVVVENGSGDESLDRLRRLNGRIKLVVSDSNLGFAGGCNLGVRNSSGDILAFLNNDAKPHRDWIRSAVEAFEDSEVGAVASRVLDWEGQRVDYVGSAMTWFGMGYKPLTTEYYKALHDKPKDVLFGTGAAMFVRRDVYMELDGFDEQYFMFFEDVDLGWRLNLLGWKYRYQPQSLAYHKHHASMNKLGAYRETYLLERNALYTLYKNAGPEFLNRALPAALLLSNRRSILEGKLQSNTFEMSHRYGDAENDMTVSKRAIAGMYAVDQFIANLDQMTEQRARIQSRRTLTDKDIWYLFGDVDTSVIADAQFVQGYESIVKAFAPHADPSGFRILFVLPESAGESETDRLLEMAEGLKRRNDVYVAVGQDVSKVNAVEQVVWHVDGRLRELSELVGWADAVITRPDSAESIDRSVPHTKPIVIVTDGWRSAECTFQRIQEAPNAANASLTGLVSKLSRHRPIFVIANNDVQVAEVSKAANPPWGSLAIPFGLTHADLAIAERSSLAAGTHAEPPSVTSVIFCAEADFADVAETVARFAAEHPEAELCKQRSELHADCTTAEAYLNAYEDKTQRLNVAASSAESDNQPVEFRKSSGTIHVVRFSPGLHALGAQVKETVLSGHAAIVLNDFPFLEFLRGSSQSTVVLSDTDDLARTLTHLYLDQSDSEVGTKTLRMVSRRLLWENALRPVEVFLEANVRPEMRPYLSSTGEHDDLRRVDKMGLRYRTGRVLYYLRNSGFKSVAQKFSQQLFRRRG